jgi:lysophospholipase L1-like esterase
MKIRYLFWLFFTLILLPFSNIAMASDKEQIVVKEIERLLEAPDGVSYQWYLNGDALEGENEQYLANITNSGKYTVEVFSLMGKSSRNEVFIIAEANAIRKIFLIGDSTVCNYNTNKYPMAGWGQVLQNFIKSDAFTIDNRAIGGRSSRSFWEEGRWTSVKSAMKLGDFLLIQFGHNDRDSKPERYTSPTDYKKYLRIYVNEARAIGVTPILVTPMVMNAWRNGALRNVFTESGAEYAQSMKEVATELSVPLIDLNQKSWNFVSSIGVNYATRFIYNTYLAGEYPNYPGGLNDGTHFQEMGAIQMAKFVAEGINELKNNTLVKDLSAALKPQYQVTIIANVAGAGVITRSESYPEGVTITLKTLVNNGHTFLNWKNSTNTVISTNTISTFKMPAAPTSYKAYFDKEDALPLDCSGLAGGKAVLDNCGICTGGNTGIMPCTNSIQGEDACFVDGLLLESINGGFIGKGYANSDNKAGATIQFYLLADKTGTVKMNLRYANGGTSNRDAKVKLNGQDVTTLALGFGTWTEWKSASFNLNLNQGINEVVLEAVSDGGLPNIDLLAWSDTQVTSSECIITSNTTPNTNIQVSIYPNPFTNVVQLSGGKELAYLIYDISGQLVSKGICSDFCIIGESLKAGVYFIDVLIENQKQNFKVIKQ